MTRYFYTDPLEAAWMAKHFGMNFTGLWKGGGEQREYDCKPEDWGIQVDQPSPPYYIHLDSLHLLETQKGDLVYSNVMDTHFRVDEHFPLAPREKIIRRYGIAFMWPEVE